MDTLMRIVHILGRYIAYCIRLFHKLGGTNELNIYLASHPRKRLRTGDSKGKFFSLNVAKFVSKNNLKTHWCIKCWIEEIVTIL